MLELDAETQKIVDRNQRRTDLRSVILDNGTWKIEDAAGYYDTNDKWIDLSHVTVYGEYGGKYACVLLPNRDGGHVDVARRMIADAIARELVK